MDYQMHLNLGAGKMENFFKIVVDNGVICIDEYG